MTVPDSAGTTARRPIAVLGAGMAGLTAANDLARRGLEVQVFESSEAIAGMAQSFRDDHGVRFDFGPHLITSRLAAALGVSGQAPVVAEWQEAVWLAGRIHAFPQGLLTCPRFVTSALAARVRLGRRAPVRSAADWYRAHCGRRMAEEIAIPLVEGWAGVSAEDLAPAVIPPQADRGIGNVLWLKVAEWLTGRASANGVTREKPETCHVWQVYPRGGMASLCDSLVRGLQGSIELKSRVEKILVENGRVRAVVVNGKEREAAAVVSTAPLPLLPRLVVGTTALADLARFRFRPMVLALMTFRGRPLLPTTLLWTPERERPFFKLIEIPRAVPFLAPEGLTSVNVDMGCELDSELYQMSEEDVGAFVLGHLEEMFPGARDRFLGCKVLRTPIGYPLYLREYEERRRALARGLPVRGLFSVGRSGEFAHILLEDVYWRTLEWMRRLRADLAAALLLLATLGMFVACSGSEPGESAAPASGAPTGAHREAAVRPPDRTVYLLDRLAEAELRSPLLENAELEPLDLPLRSLPREDPSSESVSPDASVHCYTLPAEPRDPDGVELWAADGPVPEDLAHGRVVPAEVVQPFAELEVLRDWKRARDASGAYCVHVTRPCEMAIPIEDFGVGVEIGLHLRAGSGGARGNRARPAALTVRFGGRDLVTKDVTTAQRSSLSLRLPPFVGVEPLELEFAGVIEGVGPTEVFLKDLSVHRLDDRCRLLVEGADPASDWHVRFVPRSPPLEQWLPLLRAGNPSVAMETILPKGTSSILATPPQPMQVLWNGEVLAADSASTADERRFTLDHPGCGRLEVKAEREGRLLLVRPGFLTAQTLLRSYRAAEPQSGEPWIRSEFEDPGTPLVAPVMIDESTRRCALCLAPTELSVPLWVHPGERLRFEVAVANLAASDPPTSSIELEVTMLDSLGEEHELVHSGLVPSKGSWRAIERELPVEVSGPVELRWSVRAPQGAPLSAEHLLTCLAEPQVIAAQRSSQPNVLVYLIDTLRADHCSCYGYHRPTTPNLDRLAAESILFERAYSQAPWTRPSVATLFTGHYYHFHGAGKTTGLAPALETLAEHLRSEGYATAAFVANAHVHGPGLDFDQGFTQFVAAEQQRGEARSSDVNELVLPWISEHTERPFFLYVHTIDPHAAYDPPAETAGTFQSPDYSGPIRPATTQAYNLRNFAELDDEDLQHLVDLYDEEILFNDRQLGILLHELESLDLSRNTLVVVIADHGEEFFEHGGFGHGRRLWEELLRVPFVLRLPEDDAPRGVRVAEPVGLVDLFPTLAARLTGRAPALQGQDLSPWWRGEAPSARDLLAHEEPSDACLVRGTTKLIEWSGRSSTRRRLGLFDLREDPGERHNLALEDPDLAEHWAEELHAAEALLREHFLAAEGRAETGRTNAQREALRVLGYLEPDAENSDEDDGRDAEDGSGS